MIYIAIESCKSDPASQKVAAKKAKKLLFSKNVTLKTAFDPDLHRAVKQAYLSYEESALSFGCAMTDLEGNLLVSFSGGDEDENFATSKTPPYSSFKPLSVYMQALEQVTVEQVAEAAATVQVHTVYFLKGVQ